MFGIKNDTDFQKDVDVWIMLWKTDRLMRLSEEHYMKVNNFLSERLSEKDLLDFHRMNNEFMCKTSSLRY